MKAEIDKDGYIVVSAENRLEAYAIRYIVDTSSKETCECCGQLLTTPFIFNSNDPE